MAAIYTGGSASVFYGYEGASDFGVAATTISSIFGMNQKVTSLTLNTSQIPLNKLGQVETSRFAYGQQQGSVGIGFVWDSEKSDGIFKALFGAPSGSGGVNIYPNGAQKPFTGTEGSGSVTVTPSSPLSLTTQIHQMISDGSNTLLNRTLKGCIVQSLGLSTSIGEVLNATVDMVFAKEDTTSVVSSSGFVEQLTSTNDQATTPYTFAHGVLTTSTGNGAAAIAEVQDIDLTFTTNAELLWGLGDHHAKDVFRKIFEITGRFRTASKNGQLIQAVIDQSITNNSETLAETSNVGLDLTFTDGNKSLKIELGGVSITDHSTTGIEPAEPIFEEVTLRAKSARIVSDTNNTT